MRGKSMKNKMTVRQKPAFALLVIGGLVVLSMIFATCKNDTNPTPDPKPKLTGTVNINGTMEVGKTVTADITGSNGTAGMFTYKWTRTPDGGEAITITGANGEQYTITAADLDHKLGAIIGNEDTIGTISGASASKVGPDPATLPKDQSAPLNDLFGEGYSATVKGHMTNSEWTGVAGKIETALNGAFETGAFPLKAKLRAVFSSGDGDIEIIVETNPVGYTKWKTSADGKKMYLAFGASNNDLQGSITAAVDKMIVPEAGFAKAIQQKRVDRQSTQLAAAMNGKIHARVSTHRPPLAPNAGLA